MDAVDSEAFCWLASPFYCQSYSGGRETTTRRRRRSIIHVVSFEIRHTPSRTAHSASLSISRYLQKTSRDTRKAKYKRFPLRCPFRPMRTLLSSVRCQEVWYETTNNSLADQYDTRANNCFHHFLFRYYTPVVSPWREYFAMTQNEAKCTTKQNVR